MSAADSIEGLRLAAVRAEELESFLPLIESYQRFNEVRDIDRGRNRGFFGRLIAPSQFGALLGAWQGKSPIGFACLHWCLNSVQAEEAARVHDLWVQPAVRRSGVGRALTEAAADLAHARGSRSLVWLAPPDSLAAQRLGASLGAVMHDSWAEYRLAL